MPLTPATTDKFQKVGLPGSATTMASPGYTIGNTGITVGSTTNHPTDTLYTFAIDRAQTVNGVTSRIAGTYCEFEGIVGSGSTIGNMTLKYGTAQNYPAGSFTRVYIPVSSNRENALIDGLNQDHNGKGNHKTLTDDNGNAFLTRSQVASAVNNVQVANAATGAAPSLAAIGSDTNIDLQLNAKGTGVVKVDGAAPRQFAALQNFVESGCVWSGLGYGSTLTATMTAGVVWINGKRLTVAAIATRTFTASKDTYIDFQDAGNGTATVIYTEVANNAASPVLPNSKTDVDNVRDAIVVSGATITAATSIANGGLNNTVPVVSGRTLTESDSLGNVIYPKGSSSPKKITNQIKFSVYRAAALNSTATATPVAFDTKVFDTGNNIDVVTNKGRFTAPVAGFYMFNGTVGNSAATGTNIYTQIMKNGVAGQLGSVHNSSTAPNFSHFSGVLELAANDYVELAFIGGAGSVISIGAVNCWFDGFMVSAS